VKFASPALRRTFTTGREEMADSLMMICYGLPFAAPATIGFTVTQAKPAALAG
jgi:hypothetical protein